MRPLIAQNNPAKMNKATKSIGADEARRHIDQYPKLLSFQSMFFVLYDDRGRLDGLIMTGRNIATYLLFSRIYNILIFMILLAV